MLDADGGIWFTDHGVRRERTSDRTGFHWCRADGSDAREVTSPLDAPNGIGLPPAGDHVYVAETHTGRLHVGRDRSGQVDTQDLVGGPGGRLLGDPGGGTLFDSLAVDGEGWVCVATLGTSPGITALSRRGQVEETRRCPTR